MGCRAARVVESSDFAPLLAELEEALKKRRPKPCKELMKRLVPVAPESEYERVQELKKLVDKYKFGLAHELLVKIAGTP